MSKTYHKSTDLTVWENIYSEQILDYYIWYNIGKLSTELINLLPEHISEKHLQDGFVSFLFTI